MRKFRTFYRTQSFIAGSTRALNRVPRRTNPVYPITSYLRPILILRFHERLGLSLPSFLQFPAPKPRLHLSLLPFVVKCLDYCMFFQFITQIITDEDYKSRSHSLCNFFRSHSLCNFFQSPFTSSFSIPNTYSENSFSKTIRPRSSLNARHQVSHPHKTIQKL